MADFKLQKCKHEHCDGLALAGSGLCLPHTVLEAGWSGRLFMFLMSFPDVIVWFPGKKRTGISYSAYGSWKVHHDFLNGEHFGEFSTLEDALIFANLFARQDEFPEKTEIESKFGLKETLFLKDKEVLP